MSYGNLYNKSTVKTEREYCRMSGEGSVRSNDFETARGLSSGLADSLDHNNEIAYEAHVKSKGW
jgi:hypothetical protein